MHSLTHTLSLSLSLVSSAQGNSSTASRGGVVDDILRLVPSSLTSEYETSLSADAGVCEPSALGAFGAFSAIARRHARSEWDGNDPAESLCSADVLALVNDVLDFHLCPPPSSSPSAGMASLSALSDTILNPCDELTWQCISGSSDLLTVQAATSFCLVTQQITLTVRVINSAMFKVPTFSLQVYLRMTDSEDELEPSASFLRSSESTVQEGVEYFIPGEWVRCLIDCCKHLE